MCRVVSVTNVKYGQSLAKAQQGLRCSHVPLCTMSLTHPVPPTRVCDCHFVPCRLTLVHCKHQASGLCHDVSVHAVLRISWPICTLVKNTTRGCWTVTRALQASRAQVQLLFPVLPSLKLEAAALCFYLLATSP